MRQLHTELLNALVVLGLILSGALVDSPLSVGTTGARVSAPKAHAEGTGGPSLESPRAQRRLERRADRRHDLDRDRKRDRAKADQTQNRKQKNRKQDRKRNQAKGGAENWREFCTGPGTIQLRKVDGCTHGPDPAPPGLNVEQPVPPLSAGAVTRQDTAITCEGDGQSGYRVQILYVHASDVPSRYGEYAASFRAWAADADQIFQTSAAETGGERSLRFAHDASCQPAVTEVVVSPDGDGNFWTTVDELKSQGFSRTDRIYLSFVDARAYCGVGMLWSDDRADGNVNRNNVGPGFSRVDAGCWSGNVAAHELMHNLGGVQLSAPNASGGFHCIDEWDVMCYSDAGSDLPLMQFACAETALNATRFDCGHDDYYNTNPAPGSYLDTSWNPANNRFLINAVASPAPPLPPAPATTTSPTSDDDKGQKNKKGKRKKGKPKKSSHDKGSGTSRDRSRSKTVVKIT